MKTLGVGEVLEVKTLLRGTIRLLLDNLAASLVAFAIIVAASIGYDLAFPTSFNNFGYGVAALFAGFFLTKITLTKLGYIHRTSSAGLAFWGLSILKNIGVIVGLILLVVPGVILTLRWSASVPFLIANEIGVDDALGESWRRTKGEALSILFTYIILGLPLLVIIAAAAIISRVDVDPSSLVFVVIINCVLSLWQLLNIYLQMAIYLGLTDHPEDIEEVFG